MRFDLPPPEYDDMFTDAVVGRVEHDRATGVILVCYPDEVARDGVLPRADLVTTLRKRLADIEVKVSEALCVTDGRFWSYLCDDRRCCPEAGTPVPADTTGPVAQLAATWAFRGRAVLADRAELERSIAPVTFLARRTMEQSLDAAEDELDEALLADRKAVHRRTVDLVTELVHRYRDPRTAAMSDEEAARVILGLHNLTARDRVLAAAGRCAAADDSAEAPTDEPGLFDAYLAVFSELARRALPPDDAPTLTALAWIAYARGNGALTNVALERALRTDPDYRLADLLGRLLAGQVPPSEMVTAWVDNGDVKETPDWPEG